MVLNLLDADQDVGFSQTASSGGQQMSDGFCGSWRREMLALTQQQSIAILLASKQNMEADPDALHQIQLAMDQEMDRCSSPRRSPREVKEAYC
jgi:hypothetical protein